jgi:hypothetical protein
MTPLALTLASALGAASPDVPELRTEDPWAPVDVTAPASPGAAFEAYARSRAIHRAGVVVSAAGWGSAAAGVFLFSAGWSSGNEGLFAGGLVLLGGGAVAAWIAGPAMLVVGARGMARAASSVVPVSRASGDLALGLLVGSWGLLAASGVPVLAPVAGTLSFITLIGATVFAANQAAEAREALGVGLAPFGLRGGAGIRLVVWL